MTKSIAIIVAVVVLCGGLYFLTAGKSDAPAGETGQMSQSQVALEDESIEEEEEEEEEEDEKSSGVGTFASLLALGKKVKCDIRHTDPKTGKRTEGTMYIAGESVRSEITLHDEGRSDTLHMIHDGDYAYIWGNGPMGAMATKYKLDDFELEEDTNDDTTQDPFRSDDEVEYDCDKWRKDPETFVPPSDITFEDMSAQMEALQQMTTGGGGASADMQAAQCAACDQAPVDVRAECREALGC